jgi:hypothetical protein
LGVLRLLDGSWVLGEELWPPELSSQAASLHFQERLTGYRRSAEVVNIGGTEVPVVTFEPPDSDRARYAELISSGNPVPMEP